MGKQTTNEVITIDLNSPIITVPAGIDVKIIPRKQPEPKITFADQGELNAYLADYQRLLFLEDWIIRAQVKDAEDGVAASICPEPALNRAEITINAKYHNYPETWSQRITRYCVEQFLVHELLHLQIGCEPGQEQLVEKMSKSIIMIRYSLPFSWFKNPAEVRNE